MTDEHFDDDLDELARELADGWDDVLAMIDFGWQELVAEGADWPNDHEP